MFPESAGRLCWEAALTYTSYDRWDQRKRFITPRPVLVIVWWGGWTTCLSLERQCMERALVGGPLWLQSDRIQITNAHDDVK